MCASRLYMNGVSVNAMALYPAVALPVSSSTPMLSSLVHWNHTDSWPVPTAADFLARGSTGSAGNFVSSVEVDVSSPDSEDAYLSDHVVDGRVVIPATFYVVEAWRHLAAVNGQSYHQTRVCFDDVHIHRATVLPSTGTFVHCLCDASICCCTSIQWDRLSKHWRLSVLSVGRFSRLRSQFLLDCDETVHSHFTCLGLEKIRRSIGCTVACVFCCLVFGNAK